MGIPTISLSFTPIILATILNMIIGMFWYSQSGFGKTWMTLSGMNSKKINKPVKGMGKLYLISTLCSLIIAVVLSAFIKYTTASTFLEGAVIGVILCLGFIATTMINSVLWEGKTFKLYLLNVSYYFISFALMGGLIASW